MNKVLIILGPTAAGKTALSLDLAKQLNGELISADSRQVYKGLDIVTGKDIPATDIHGYDLIYPHQDWNVSSFQNFAHKTISSIHHEQKLPIVVGGTGLYINSIINPVYSPGPNPKLRKRLETLNVAQLQLKLKEINSERLAAMNNSDANNPRRLIRAIEIEKAENLKITTFFPKYDTLLIGLNVPIEALQQRIYDRVLKRLEQDLQKELHYLQSFNLRMSTPASTTLGYKELTQYYSGEITKEELISLWAAHELQYAKRQLTWFKKQKNINWFDVTNLSYPHEVVDKVTSWYSQS